MSKSNNALNTALGLLFCAALGYAAYLLIITTFRVISNLESTVAVAIIGAAAAVIGSSLSLMLGKRYEARERTKQILREKKIPVYEKAIKFMTDTMAGEKAGAKPTEPELLKHILEFTQESMVWASDDVLAEWIKWKRFASTEAMADNPRELLFQFEGLVKAMRRDLGHRNQGILKGDILVMFVTDMDKHLADDVKVAKTK